eukprot:m.40171 g.40171  ORF g.40171 m.40171 type:complete len:126 (+) comp12730_c0_seq4:381-758(+)
MLTCSRINSYFLRPLLLASTCNTSNEWDRSTTYRSATFFSKSVFYQDISIPHMNLSDKRGINQVPGKPCSIVDMFKTIRTKVDASIPTRYYDYHVDDVHDLEQVLHPGRGPTLAIVIMVLYHPSI